MHYGFCIAEYVAAGVALYLAIPFLFCCFPSLQRQLIFMNLFQWRYRRGYFDPDQHCLSGARNLYLIPKAGVKIGIWQILPMPIANEVLPKTEVEWETTIRNSSNPIVIYFHGNMGNRATGHRVDLYRLLQSHWFHVIAFDYRSFGDSYSAGSQSETGLVEDSKYVYEWVLNNLLGGDYVTNRRMVYFWAHSLGSAVSTHLVAYLSSQQSLPAPSGLVLEAPFTNMTDAALSSPMSLIYRPLSSFGKNFLTENLKANDVAFQSDRHIQKINIPILILHAQLDVVVPFKLGEELYNIDLMARAGNAEKVLLKRFVGEDRFTSHALLWREPDLMNTFNRFTSLCVPVERSTSDTASAPKT